MRNRRNLNSAQRLLTRDEQNSSYSPYLTNEDYDLIRQGEDLDVEELCVILRSRSNQSLLEQVQRIRSYRQYLRRHHVHVFGTMFHENCLYIMCLIMAITLAKGRHITISNVLNN
jgi:hypothetical protein